MPQHPFPHPLTTTIIDTLAALGWEEHSPDDFKATLTLRGTRFNLHFHTMQITLPNPTEGDLLWCNEQQESAESATQTLAQHLHNAPGIASSVNARGEEVYSGHLHNLTAAIDTLREAHGLPIAPRSSRTR